MFTSFFVALNAVLPFVLYMSIGAAVVKMGLVDRPFMRKLNGFCFKAFFPFMTFMNIYDMEGEIGLSGEIRISVKAIENLVRKCTDTHEEFNMTSLRVKN